MRHGETSLRDSFPVVSIQYGMEEAEALGRIRQVVADLEVSEAALEATAEVRDFLRSFSYITSQRRKY